MLDSGGDKCRLKTSRDKGSLKVVFKGARILGASAATLGNDRLRKRFKVFRLGAHTQE